MKIIRLISLTFIFTAISYTQTATLQDDEDLQSWNDVQLTIPVHKKLDLVTKLTLRFGNNISRLRDGRYHIGVAWKPTSSLSISPFYWHIEARNTAGQFRTEHRLNLALAYKFPVKSFGLVHRSTLERRLRASGNSWRYRAQLALDKNIPQNIIPDAKWFISNEVFYDSATDRFSRNRFSIGVTKNLNPKLTLDIYYTRQNDGYAHPGDLNVIGTSWKIKL